MNQFYYTSKFSFLVLIASILIIAGTACSGSQNNQQDEKSGQDTVASKPEGQVQQAEGAQTAGSDQRQRVIITTNMGNIILELYNETPRHRDNFLKLIREGYYNKTLFHRVIKDFMIQGGDPDSKNAGKDASLGRGGPGYTIPAEFSPKFYHKKGALAAARQSDEVNPQKASSGSQFYIVHGKKYTKNELENISFQSGISFSAEQVKSYETIGGTPFLDMNYTVFGEVVEGLDVVDKIAEVKTEAGNRPVKDISMDIKLVEVK